MYVVDFTFSSQFYVIVIFWPSLWLQWRVVFFIWAFDLTIPYHALAIEVILLVYVQHEYRVILLIILVVTITNAVY